MSGIWKVGVDLDHRNAASNHVCTQNVPNNSDSPAGVYYEASVQFVPEAWLAVRGMCGERNRCFRVMYSF